MNTLGLAHLPGRCPDCEHHVPTQGCHCPESNTTEWSIFLQALRTAVRPDQTVHACDVRPLVRDRVAPRTISTFYRRARAEHLLDEAGHERSDDVRGKNAGRLEPFYTYRSAA